uniref:Uncharacterized protein n=1 Tax=Norrisiella sphaerica TaxID=552664 RepID=A0A7S2QSW1_9EUKA
MFSKQITIPNLLKNIMHEFAAHMRTGRSMFAVSNNSLSSYIYKCRFHHFMICTNLSFSCFSLSSRVYMNRDTRCCILDLSDTSRKNFRTCTSKRCHLRT